MRVRSIFLTFNTSYQATTQAPSERDGRRMRVIRLGYVSPERAQRTIMGFDRQFHFVSELLLYISSLIEGVPGEGVSLSFCPYN